MVIVLSLVRSFKAMEQLYKFCHHEFYSASAVTPVGTLHSYLLWGFISGVSQEQIFITEHLVLAYILIDAPCIVRGDFVFVYTAPLGDLCEACCRHL